MQREKYNLALISASTFFLYGSLSVFVYLSLFLKSQGFNDATIGVVVSLFSWTALLFRVAGGRISDLYSPKKLLIAGSAAFLSSTIGFAFVGRSLPVIVLLRVLQGLGFSWFGLGSLLQSVEGLSREKFSRNVTLLAVFYLSPYILFPFIAEQIWKSAGFPRMFLFAAVLCALSLPGLLFLQTGEREPTQEQNFRFSFPLPFFAAWNFLFGWCVSAAFSFSPLIKKLYPQLNTGSFFTTMAVLAVIMRAFLGIRIPLWGRPEILPPAFLSFAAGFLGLSLTNSQPLLIASAVFTGIGLGSVYPNVMALTLKHAPPCCRGRALGVVAAVGDLGHSSGPVVFGFLSYSFGLQKAFFIWWALISVLALLTFALYRKGRASSK